MHIFFHQWFVTHNFVFYCPHNWFLLHLRMQTLYICKLNSLCQTRLSGATPILQLLHWTKIVRPIHPCQNISPLTQLPKQQAVRDQSVPKSSEIWKCAKYFPSNSEIHVRRSELRVDFTHRLEELVQDFWNSGGCFFVPCHFLKYFSWQLPTILPPLVNHWGNESWYWHLRLFHILLEDSPTCRPCSLWAQWQTLIRSNSST